MAVISITTGKDNTERDFNIVKDDNTSYNIITQKSFIYNAKPTEKDDKLVFTSRNREISPEDIVFLYPCNLIENSAEKVSAEMHSMIEDGILEKLEKPSVFLKGYQKVNDARVNSVRDNLIEAHKEVTKLTREIEKMKSDPKVISLEKDSDVTEGIVMNENGKEQTLLPEIRKVLEENPLYMGVTRNGEDIKELGRLAITLLEQNDSSELVNNAESLANQALKLFVKCNL